MSPFLEKCHLPCALKKRKSMERVGGDTAAAATATVVVGGWAKFGEFWRTFYEGGRLGEFGWV